MKEVVNPVFRRPADEGIVPCWTGKSKYLMLGSITAVDGMRKGFYYASDRNQLWALMDYCLGTNDFVELKTRLKNNYLSFVAGEFSKQHFCENKKLIQDDFRNTLDKHDFAFCDVFKSCWFNNNSSLDQDIILNNPNYAFETSRDIIQYIIDNSSVQTVFCNSKFVEERFRKMDIKGDFKVVVLMSPSQRRGVIEKKMEDWKPKFDAVLKNDVLTSVK